MTKPSDIIQGDNLADIVCHDEQMTIWADDFAMALAMQTNCLSSDMSYEDKIDMFNVLKAEIRRVIEHALTHPEIIGM